VIPSVVQMEPGASEAFGEPDPTQPPHATYALGDNVEDPASPKHNVEAEDVRDAADGEDASAGLALSMLAPKTTRVPGTQQDPQQAAMTPQAANTPTSHCQAGGHGTQLHDGPVDLPVVTQDGNNATPTPTKAARRLARYTEEVQHMRRSLLLSNPPKQKPT
jgi:hypothetical protein